MEIIVAKKSRLCYGVKRALNIAKKTRRLSEGRISKRILPRTFFNEKASQITPQMLRGAKKIGISGGASTPPEDIQEAVVIFRKSSKQSTRREKSVQCPR